MPISKDLGQTLLTCFDTGAQNELLIDFFSINTKHPLYSGFLLFLVIPRTKLELFFSGFISGLLSYTICPHDCFLNPPFMVSLFHNL